MARQNDNYFDIGYGLASVAISTTGVTVVATNESKYHGVSIIASATAMTVKVFNTAAGTGNLIDVIYAAPGCTGWSDKYIPIVARKGLTVSVTGTGGTGVIFFSPKG